VNDGFKRTGKEAVVTWIHLRKGNWRKPQWG